MTVDDIMDALGGRKAVASALGVSRCAPYNWRQDGIPARHWPDLMQRAAVLGIKGVSFEVLRVTGTKKRWMRERRVTTDSTAVRKSSARDGLRAGHKIETAAA